MHLGTSVTLPPSVSGAVYFVDEAGSKGTLGQHFVTAAVKTTDPDGLLRAVQAVRDRNRFTRLEELKFSKVTKTSVPILTEVMEVAVEAGCQFGAFVLDKRHFDPWADRAQWRGHLFASERLLRGMATRREIAVALLDHISVPEGVSYGDTLLQQLNGRFGNKRFVAAVSLDSRTCAGLQVADLLASAIFHYRRKVEEGSLELFLQNGSPKAQLSRAIAAALGVGSLADCNTSRLSIATSHEKSLKELTAGR